MEKVKNWTFVVLGAVIASLSLTLILMPNNMEPGGISGIAVIINNLTGGLIPVGALIAALNLPIFILGWKFLGRKFIIKSIIGALLYSGLTYLFEFLFKNIQIQVLNGLDMILLAVYGGVMYGIGIGLVLKGGASTGGTDIIAKLMLRKLSWLSLGQILLGFDIILLIVLAITYKSIPAALYSGIALFIDTRMVDIVEGGLHYAKQARIIIPADADSSDLISAIEEKLHKSVTKLSGQGMYSGNDVQVLLCVVSNKQLSRLREMIKKRHPNAFVIVTDVREVQGAWRKS